jgi:hypothetical protein
MEIKDLYKEWIRSPLRFVKEVIQAEPSWQQEQALNAIGELVLAKIRLSRGEKLNQDELKLAKKMGISIQSGHGTGKDAFSAWAICWFLSCFPNSKIPCTAPTSDQLDSILWSEIYKWVRNSKKDSDGVPILSKWLTIQNKKVLFTEGGGKEWFAVARTSNPKSSTEEQAETLAGFHEDYLMIVIDEASGVPEPVFKPLEGGLTGKVNFMLMVFNPTRDKGFAINSQKGNRGDWICLRWNSEESPLVEKTFIEHMARKYGKDSNPYRIRVLGLPPIAAEDTLIPWEWIQDAVERQVIPMQDDPVIFGVDAGAGGDHSSIIRRVGPKVEEIKRINTKQTMELTGQVSLELNIFENYQGCCVDNIGIGLGVYNRLQELGHRRVFAADVRRSPRDAQRFCRLRDELWWKLRTMFEEGTISIPNDDELIAQLSVIKWKTESDGRIKIESKEDMVKRGIASPNDADALMLSMFLNDAAFRIPSVKNDYWEDAEIFKRAKQRATRGENSWMAS